MSGRTKPTKRRTKRIGPHERHLLINPVTKALVRKCIEQDIERLRVAANLHAHMGGDANALLNLTGRMVYIVGYAAGKAGLGESPDGRILSGTGNALGDLHAQPGTLEAQRQTILSGLAAIDRLMPQLDTFDLADGAMRLDALLRRGDMGTADIQRALQQAA